MALGKTDWFTLAELVVVIAVIAVLFTIGTFSYLGNVQHAENSVRLSNLSSLSASIQDARQRNGSYPVPDDWVAVTYSGAIAWKQGVAGQSVAAAVGRSQPPEDPQYWALYAYSVSSDWRLFQLASAFDWSEASNGAVPVAYAAALSAVTAGNYNGLAVAASDGLKNWIVAAPSIVLGSLAQPEMTHPSAENRFVFDGWNTLPNTYSGLAPRAGQAGPAFQPRHVYYWTGANRYPTDPEWWSSLSAALATAYSGTAVSKILPDPAAWECELAEFWRKALTTVLAWSTDARRFAQERVAKVGAATCLETGANRQVPCTWSWVPSGAAGTGLFEQTWNGYSWTPSVVPALSYWADACGFVCAAWRTWNGSSCVQNPSCWTANGAAAMSAPSWGALCSFWTASAVTNNVGTFSWTCSNAPAAAANCSAPRQYLVTFDANGGWTSSPATKNVTHNTAVWTLATVARTGFAFNGWFTAASGGTQVTAATAVTADVTWYAQWTPLTYSVSGTFGPNASGATVSVCGTNVAASSTGSFIRTGIPHGSDCANVTAARAGFSCSTAVNGPNPLAGNFSTVAGSCAVTYSWQYGSWSSCSASTPTLGSWSSCSASCWGWTRTRTCSTAYGSETRTATCKGSDWATYADSYCGTPVISQSCSTGCSGYPTSESCNTQSCCKPSGYILAYQNCQWWVMPSTNYQAWSECCGGSIARRCEVSWYSTLNWIKCQ